MGLIYLLLIFILFVIIGVLSMAGSIIRTIFGVGSSVFGRKTQRKNNEGYPDNTDTARTRTTYERRGKLFGPHEGEYVDFEEVEEEDKL